MAKALVLHHSFCCCQRKDDSDNECTVIQHTSQTSVPIDEWELDLKDTADGENDSTANQPESDQSGHSMGGLFKSIFHASADNRLALKLYGNKREIITEQNRQDSNCCSRWMVHPFSHFR